MKLTKIISQSRRDVYITIKCEGCNALETNVSAYDDRNYWDNVLPDRKCKSCGKSSIDLGTPGEHIATKYGSQDVV